MADDTSENPIQRNRVAIPSEPEQPAADDAVSFLEKQLAQEAPDMDPGLRKSLARLGSAFSVSEARFLILKRLDYPIHAGEFNRLSNSPPMDRIWACRGPI